MTQPGNHEEKKNSIVVTHEGLVETLQRIQSEAPNTDGLDETEIERVNQGKETRIRLLEKWQQVWNLSIEPEHYQTYTDPEIVALMILLFNSVNISTWIQANNLVEQTKVLAESDNYYKWMEDPKNEEIAQELLNTGVVFVINNGQKDEYIINPVFRDLFMQHNFTLVEDEE